MDGATLSKTSQIREDLALASCLIIFKRVCSKRPAVTENHLLSTTPVVVLQIQQTFKLNFKF
jgi:hypothetical protein